MNKKGSKAAKEVSSYEIRDIVLGKVRGFPPWPGQVVDPSSAPEGVLKERPSSKKTVFYCVQFFPTGDYAWLLPKDISKLQPHEIEAYINEPFKRSGELLEGYRIARNPKDWEESRAAAAAVAAEEDNDNEVDQLESVEDGGEDDEDEEGTKKKLSKKRKRESDAAAAKQSKAKASSKKKDAGEGAQKKGAAGGGKGRKSGAGKSKAAVESEDEAEHEDADDVDGQGGGPSKKSSPPPAKKAKRDKEDPIENDPEAIKVRDWRHKLQKVFLSNKQAVPKESDMPGMDELFTQIEQYDKINIQYLSFSKIGKVMRHIVGLTDSKVPRDDEFKFRERAKVLVDKWHQILNANKTSPNTNITAVSTATAMNVANGTGAGANGAVSTKATTNGTTNGNELGKTDGAIVEEKAAQLDLNGEAPAADAMQTEALAMTEPGDVSALGDITMSEMAD